MIEKLAAPILGYRLLKTATHTIDPFLKVTGVNYPALNTKGGATLLRTAQQQNPITICQ
jgi:hypothetical protein